MTLFIGSVGIDRHKDPTIRDLNGAKRDAMAVWALFVDTLPEATSSLLTDDSATLAAVENLLATTLDAAGPEDTVILNFAGHGTHDHRVVLHDTLRMDLPGTTLAMADLARRFRESRAKAVICFLDCCFSGGAPARVLEDSPTPRDPQSPLQTITGTGRVLVSASNHDEEALEDPVTRHGLFTNALIAALQGDRPASIVQLVDAIAARVRADAGRFGHVQTPVIFGHVEGQITIPALRKGPVYASHFPEFSGVQVSADFQSLAAYGINQGVLAQWTAKYPMGLNQLQLAAINDHQILDGDSLLVVAPTSAGKTFVGELAAMRAAGEGKKAVFLLPYRALVNEKYEDFRLLYGDPAGLRIARCSGDWQDQVPAILRGKYDIAFFTYETFLGLALTSPHILYQIGLVVVDEAQFIADAQRGITVELLLTHLLSMRTRGLNPQLVLLSAVMGGTNSLDDWLGCRLLTSTQRPVPLTEGVINRRGGFQSLSPTGAVETSQLLPAHLIVQRRTEASSQDVIVPLVRQLVAAGEKVLIFRNNRGSAQGCAKYLADELGLSPAQEVIDTLPELDQSVRSRQLRECLLGGTAFHSGDLKAQERIAVEISFRDPVGPVKVLVATSTVAAGVNTPASTVIIVETKFRGDDGEKPYTVAQYKNMAGRAGRLGFREEGRSVLIAETGMDQGRLFATYVQGTPEAIKSSFSDRSPDTWLIRLLAQGPKVAKQQAVDLLANTYGGYLASRADPQWRTRIAPQIQDLVSRMLANGLLEEYPDSTIHLTLLGSACGQSPFELASALQVVEMLRRLTSGVTARDIMAIVQATPEMDADYTPLSRARVGEPGRQIEVAQRFSSLISSVLQTRAREQGIYHRRCKRALILADWIDGVAVDEIERRYSPNAFSTIAAGDITGYADSSRFYLQSAFKMASVIFGGVGLTEAEVTGLTRQLEVGIPAAALPLMDVPFALTRGEYLALHSLAINDLAALRAADQPRLIALLGKRRAMQLIQATALPASE